MPIKPHEIQQDGVDGMARLQSYHIECWLPLGACIGENQLGAMIFDNESDLGYLYTSTVRAIIMIW